MAGATLAWHFYRNGVKFKVFDSGVNHSSRVAAGMVNPIVFKRLTKSWRADELMPQAAQFYKSIESELGVKLLSHRSIKRIFSSVEEENNWSMLIGDGRFENFLKPTESLEHKYIQAPYGTGLVNSLGHLDVNEFLDSSKRYLSAEGVEFVDRPFVTKMLDNNYHYIYCEGYQLIQNPFFHYVKMKPTHGEVLIIHAPDLNSEEILNKNMFILPIGKDHYKVGSTYDWERKDPIITQAGKTELIDKLKSFCSFEFEVVRHEAGIRPTIADRRPVLGTHFEMKMFTSLTVLEQKESQQLHILLIKC